MHARAQQLADLHGREPDAAGRAEHQQRLSRRDGRPRLERVVGGDVRHQERGTFLEREAFGQRPDRARRHDGFLGVAAGAHLRDHLLPDGNALDVRGDLGHDAGASRPGTNGNSGRCW